MKKLCLILLMLFLLTTPANALLIYSGGTGYGRSTSDFSQHNWNYKYSYHELGLQGRSFLGDMASSIKFEERDGYGEIAFLQLKFKGQEHEFVLGDNSSGLTDITLPYLAYQGMYFKSTFIPNLDMTIISGTGGNKLWGETVRRETRDLTSFNGFRLVLFPKERVSLNTTFVAGQGGKEVTSFGGSLNLTDNMALSTEFGSSDNIHAFINSFKIKNDALFFEGTFRNIDKDYETPVGIVSYKGQKGYYINSSLTPSKYLYLSGKLNKYFDKLYGDGDTENEDSSLMFRLKPSSSTAFNVSTYTNDRRGYVEGGFGSGKLVELRQGFGRSTLFAKFEPSKFSNEDDEADDYKQDKATYGVQLSLTDRIFLDVASELKDKLFIVSDEKTQTKAALVGIYLGESKLGSLPITLSFSAKYRNEVQPDESILTTLFGDATLRWKPTNDLSSYLIVRTSDVNGEEILEVTRNLTEVKFGLTCSFNI